MNASEDSIDEAENQALREILERPKSSARKKNSIARRRAIEKSVREQRESVYHQARILILTVALSGKQGSVDSLTKLAKIDFLLRYPTFLERLAQTGAIEGLTLDGSTAPRPDERIAVESRMIRYKYGPWDNRYYGTIGALVSRGLVEYVPSKRSISIRPTETGRILAKALEDDPEWKLTAARSKLLHEHLGRMSGNSIKDLIYSQLPDVVNRPHRAEI